MADPRAGSWLEVALVVDGELAEAAAEVLARFAPGGVAIESTAIGASPDDVEGYVIGPLRVAAYLPFDENLEEKRRQLEEALWYLGRIRPLPPAQFRLVQEADWAQAWKEHYHPIAVGRRLMIVPAWLEPPEGDHIVIRMDPGMAFGTGTHPTTRLCMELIEDFCATYPAAGAMIDLGCGSGILAVAALKMGVLRALGVDIDPTAIRVASENAALNQVQGRMEVKVGSLEEIRGGAMFCKEAPLVAANILAVVLIRLLEEGLAEIVAPGGTLILSGILEEQIDDVVQAAEKHGLVLADLRREGDWSALSFSRPGMAC